MKKNWIEVKEQTPETGKFFIVRSIGAKLNTNWKLRVWDKNTFERHCNVHHVDMLTAEYLYID